MPFCSKCGNEVRSNDRFCKKCGAPQPVTPGAGSQPADPFASLDPHITASLCYIPFLGWIVSIFVLSIQRFRTENEIRFHAFQGLFIFIVWLIYDWVLESLLYELIPQPWQLTRIIKIAFTVGWIWMVYQTSNRVMVRIPVLAEWADKSVNEQAR
jgi:uncharacterized membrane protein